MRNSGHSYSSASREKSPCRQKVEQLAEKIQTIGVEDDSKARRELFVQRARTLYDKLERAEQNDDSRAKLFKEQIQKLEEELNEERGVRETFEEEKRDALTVLDKEFSQLVGSYRKEVLNREANLEAKIDDRYSRIRSEVQVEQRKRLENQNESVRNISDHICELNGMISAQRKNR